jgi:hypothetical protein
MTAMMKIEQQPRTYFAVRAIGAGIPNVLFADPRTVDNVRECVRAVRAETPATGGIHGVGMRRGLRGGRGLARVRAGPRGRGGGGDDREGLGGGAIPGQWEHPRVKEAEARVIKTALRLGVAPRVEIDTPDQAKPYLDMGVKHFRMGWDVGILFDGLKGNGAKLRAMMGA